MKKKILAVILCLSVLAMVGCGKTESQQPAVGKQSESVSNEIDLESIYLSAKGHLEERDYATAIKELETIPDYKDVKELLQDARYEYGIALYDKSQYAGAIEQLEQVGEYKETASYLNKSYMEQKYEDFDYDSFSTLADDSTATMTNKEIREYMEECQEALYDTWYQHENEDKSIEIEKYKLDGKVYKVVSWGGEGNYTEFDICYIDDAEKKEHIILAPDFTYLDVAETPTMYLIIGDKCYNNYSSSQADAYAALNESQKESTTAPSEYYMPGTAYSNTFGIYVNYAHIGYDTRQKTNLLLVNCTIENMSDSNIVFVASNYFSLENAGIIVAARASEYDNCTVAPGGAFSTELAFNTKITKNVDIDNMYLIMENARIYLGPAPQSEDLRNAFEGWYTISFDVLLIVTNTGDGKYRVARVNPYGNRIFEDVELDGNNGFWLDDSEYRWRPDDRAIDNLDSYDEDDEEDNYGIKTWYKVNPTKD